MINNIDKQSFGEAGCVLVAPDSEVPAGQYCAVSFLGGGSITVAFSASEAPLLSGDQTVPTFADGYTLFTPLVIGASSAARADCVLALYKAL